MEHGWTAVAANQFAGSSANFAAILPFEFALVPVDLPPAVVISNIVGSTSTAAIMRIANGLVVLVVLSGVDCALIKRQKVASFAFLLLDGPSSAVDVPLETQVKGVGGENELQLKGDALQVLHDFIFYIFVDSTPDSAWNFAGFQVRVALHF